jgi:hypothetical protein
MQRRISYFLTALAVFGSFAAASLPGGASADEFDDRYNRCQEYNFAIQRHSDEGNIGYALELAKMAEADGWAVTRDRSPGAEERRLMAE